MSVTVNITTNGTPPLNCFSNSTAEKIGATFAYCLIFVVSLVGNSLIGIIVYKTRTMRKPINFLIVNMAMSWLLYSIFHIPEGLTWLYVGSWLISGPRGQALCKLVNLLRDAPTTAAVQSLVLIVVDQFGAVVFPLRSPLISSKRCPFFILATWIFALALWSPHLFADKLVEYQGELQCVGVWTDVLQVSSSFENYILAIIVADICIPLVLIAILYTIIYVKVRSLTIPDEQSPNERQPLVQRVPRERTVLKVAITIVLCFVVCWLPASIILILAQLVSDIRSCGFQYFAVVAFFMTLANYAINPCILFLVSKSFRQSLKNLVRRFSGHSRGNQTPRSQMWRRDRKNNN